MIQRLRKKIREERLKQREELVERSQCNVKIGMFQRRQHGWRRAGQVWDKDRELGTGRDAWESLNRGGGFSL